MPHSGTPLRLALAGAVAMGCAMGIGRFVYTPILPFMVEALHLSASQAGLIASANFLGYLIGALATSARLPGSPRAWLVGALLGSAVTTAAVGLFTDVTMIAAMRFLGGIASAFSLVFESTQVLQALARAGRSGLSAVHFGGVGIGIAASALVILLPVGWQAMWFVSGAATLVGAIVVAVMLPSAEEGTARAAAKAPAPSGGLGRLIVAYGLFGFGYVITATFIVAIVRGQPELKAFEPMAWLVVGLAGAPSVWFWMTVAKRTGMVRGYALACAVEAFGVLLSLFTAVVVTRNFLHVLQLAGISQHPALYGLPQSALKLPRYRPSERRTQRAGSLALAGGGSVAVAAGPEVDAEDVEEDDETSAASTGNGSNGGTPTSRRAGATNTVSGGEE